MTEQVTTDRRMLPPKKKRGVIFEVGGKVIVGKDGMKAKCQQIMSMAPWSGPQRNHCFRSQTLIDLIGKYHYFCPKLGLIPDKFRKDTPPPGYNGYYLMGHFIGAKGDGWHGVSWHKCITHPTFAKEVSESLRRRVHATLAVTRESHCAACGDTQPPFDMDHYNPTWEQIMSEVIPIFTEDEANNWMGFNWWDYEEFTLPESHPALIKFFQVHSQSTLTTLCKPCHKNATRGRAEL